MKFVNWIRKIFKKKNNIVFFVLGLVVSMISTFAIAIIPMRTEKEFSDAACFPESIAFSVLKGSDYKKECEERFKGLNKEYFLFYEKNISINLLSDTNYSFRLVGVENHFENFPIPYYKYGNAYVEKSSIITGESFSEDDILLCNRYVILDSIFFQIFNISSDTTLEINGMDFYVKGALSCSDYNKRHINDESPLVQIYMPYSTLYSFVGNDSIVPTVVLDSQGKSFTYLYDDQNFNSFDKIEYLKNKYKENLVKESVPFIASTYALAFASIFIVQFILIRNKHYEIGIKRAIGASKHAIIFDYLTENVVVSYVSAFFGVLLGITFSLLYFLNDALVYYYSLFIGNMDLIFLLNIVLVLISNISDFIALFFGTRVNIASIIVEER